AVPGNTGETWDRRGARSRNRRRPLPRVGRSGGRPPRGRGVPASIPHLRACRSETCRQTTRGDRPDSGLPRPRGWVLIERRNYGASAAPPGWRRSGRRNASTWFYSIATGINALIGARSPSEYLIPDQG